jgi:hypothetical protein
MSASNSPQLTDEQKAQLSTRYGQAMEAEKEAREAANKAIAVHRQKEQQLKKAATECTDIYQGRIPFPEQS